jgi:hypothetical protein
MGLGRERLDVYRAAIEYVGWAYRLCEGPKGHRNAKEQLLRASRASLTPYSGDVKSGDLREVGDAPPGALPGDGL